jgi:plastocyanin
MSTTQPSAGRHAPESRAERSIEDETPHPNGRSLRRTAVLDATTSKSRRRGRILLASIAVSIIAAVAGACGDSDDDDAPASAMSSGQTVVMELIAYKPEKLDVAAGTTVTWQQNDPGAHTVTSGTVEQGTGGVTTAPDGTFDSGEIATGDAFEFTFDEPGTYSYFCSLHPATMRGEVRVS